MRLPPFARTTTFRLSLAYIALILVYSLVLLGFIYTTTVGYMRTETEQRINTEIDSLVLAHSQGGLSRVTQALFERAAVPNRYFMYQLETPSGVKIIGDLSDMPSDEAGELNFEIDVRRPGGEPFVLEVEAQIVNLGAEARLLVGYNAGDRGEIVRRINRAILIAAAGGLLLSLIGGIWISRGVAKRAQGLVDVAEDVMAGDLTARAKKRGLDDEFDRLADRLNAMLDRLQALVKASRHTGDAIAHDLRSPLSRMRNRLETAMAGEITAESSREVLGETVEEVDNVLNTFNAILRLSTIDAHAQMRLVRIDAGELVEALSEWFEPAAEQEGLSFVASSARNIQVIGDREMVAQAVSNLIDNAIKYTPSGGSIEVSARRGPDKFVDIIVKDSGPGIPESERERVKQRFVRMDSARTQAGSGLGLALVDAVAMAHRGMFELLDGDGPPDRPGLKAVLRLPRA